MPPASPSSVFLVPTKNLSREQCAPRRYAISWQQPIDLSITCTCFGRVSVNYPGSSLLIPQLVHERHGRTAASFRAPGQQRNSVTHARRSLRLERLSSQVRDDAASRSGPARSNLLGCLQDVIVDIEGRSHGGIISHHSSDVTRARTARQEVGECARREDPGSVLQLSDESQVSRHKKGGGLRRKDLPEMVVSFPAASGRRRLDLEHNSVGGGLRQDNVHIGLGELMPAGDVPSQQDVPILKQQFVREQEAKLAGEHAVQDPGSRGERDCGEKAGHQHVCVDNSRTLRHLLRRLALVSETASLIAVFSDIAHRFRARATRAAAWLAVLIPYASRLSSTSANRLSAPHRRLFKRPMPFRRERDRQSAHIGILPPASLSPAHQDIKSPKWSSSLRSGRELGGDELQVGQEKAVEALLRRPIFRPKDGGGMEGRQELRRPGGLQDPAALLHQAEIGTQERLRRGRAQAEEDLGPGDGQLRFEPGTAGADLDGSGCLVDAAFGSADELEVFDDVGDVDVLARERKKGRRVCESVSLETSRLRHAGMISRWARVASVTAVKGMLASKVARRPPFLFASASR